MSHFRFIITMTNPASSATPMAIRIIAPSPPVCAGSSGVVSLVVRWQYAIMVGSCSILDTRLCRSSQRSSCQASGLLLAHIILGLCLP